MIKNISIKNFKQFRDLKLDNLTAITIIGGKNNTGKTTLLEALFMFYDRANPEVILRHRHWRGVNLIDLSPSLLWAPIFHAYDMHKEVLISIKENNKHEKLLIKHNRELNQLIKTTPLDQGVLKSLSKSFPTESLDFNYFLEDEPVGDAHCIIDGEQLGIQVNKLKPSKKAISYISSVTQINPNDDAIRFGQMDIEGRIEELIEGLQIIEPRLKSLSSISHGNHSLIYGDLGTGKKMPLSFMGEGTAKLLSIMLAIATSRGGIVLIDEIENGVHYSVHPKLWLFLITFSKRYDCQLFLTTHSYEIIKYLKDAVEEKDYEYFSYVRLDRNQDKILPKQYDLDILFSAIERDWEIR